MELIDYGLEEVTEIDQDIIIQTGFDEYGTMQSALEEKGWHVTNTELQRIPLNTTALELNDAQKVMKLIDKMEEDDDVNAVYHNLEITEELLTQMDEFFFFISTHNSLPCLGGIELVEISISIKWYLSSNNFL